MNNIRLLRLVNPLILLVIILQALSGLAILFDIPAPPVVVLHQYNAFLLIVLSTTHVVLNWNWFRGFFFRK